MKNDYEIRGDITAIFIKYKGKVMETIIDTIDLDKAKEFPGSWFASWSKLAKKYYVSGTWYLGDYKQITVKLHRFLMNSEKGIHIDHINHDPLNNRRSVNLRKATCAENQQNREGATTRSKSGVRGVYYHKITGKWAAQIRVNKKCVHLGVHADIGEAEKTVISLEKSLCHIQQIED